MTEPGAAADLQIAARVLQRVLAQVAEGTLVADAGSIRRLEGAVLTFELLQRSSDHGSGRDATPPTG